MANDPQYVRLVDRLARGCQVDIRSGWSIAGLDVREFPEDDQPLAQTFVRDALRRGVLESCSQAEHEEVMGQDRDFLTQAGVDVTPPSVEGFYQEAHVVGAADAARRKLEASRGLGSQGMSYSDDHARRKAILKAQGSADSDDEYSQVGEQDGADGVADDDTKKEAAAEVEKEQPAKRGKASARS